MRWRCVGCHKDRDCEPRMLGALRLTLCDSCYAKATAKPEDSLKCCQCGSPIGAEPKTITIGAAKWRVCDACFRMARSFITLPERKCECGTTLAPGAGHVVKRNGLPDEVMCDECYAEEQKEPEYDLAPGLRRAIEIAEKKVEEHREASISMACRAFDGCGTETLHERLKLASDICRDARTEERLLVLLRAELAKIGGKGNA